MLVVWVMMGVSNDEFLKFFACSIYVYTLSEIKWHISKEFTNAFICLLFALYIANNLAILINIKIFWS